jgi:hypothetical protein
MKLMNLKGIKTFIAIASMLCACGTEVTVNEVIYAEDDVAKPDSYRNDVQQEEENKLVFHLSRPVKPCCNEPAY